MRVVVVVVMTVPLGTMGVCVIMPVCMVMVMTVCVLMAVVMGMIGAVIVVGAMVIASWSWSLLRDTSRVLLDASDKHLEHEVREEVEGPGDARITDLHVWRLGPSAHGAIVSYVGAAGSEEVRARLQRVHELAHVTVEARPLNLDPA